MGRCPDQGSYFLVMDLVEGIDLRRRIEHGPLPIRQAIEIVAQVADAIAHANARGIIHRDLKPSNILLDDRGQAMVTDFGLAKLFHSAQPAMSQPGQIIGTAQFMSPEQVDSARGKVGPASDVYGLGALLYALLTGKPPLEGHSVLELIAKLSSAEAVASPRTLRPDISETIEAICLKCLSKQQANRYPSASEVASTLRNAMGQDGEDPTEHVTSPHQSRPRGTLSFGESHLQRSRCRLP